MARRPGAFSMESDRVNVRNVLLFLLLVVPGVASFGLGGWWGVNDFIALTEANQQFDQLVRQSATQEELFVAAHRENTHRINVGFDGTWMLLGGIWAGIGIAGMGRSR
jgi:hypothetical protein